MEKFQNLIVVKNIILIIRYINKNELFLFTTKTCPGCETVKILFKEKKIRFNEVNATEENIKKFNLDISTVPFFLYFDNNGKSFYFVNVFSIKEFILNFKK